MTSRPTSPLRPPRTRQPELARWLQSRAGAICDAWIERVLAYPPSAAGRTLTPLAEAQLRQIYAELCSSLDIGHFSAFDGQLAALTREGHRHGYRVTDLQYAIIALDDQAWQAGMAEFLPDQALPHLHALSSTLASALTHVARVYDEEVHARVAAELDKAYGQPTQLDRAKSTFIGIAAHELKTPLTLIQGYSDILLNDVIDPANERAVFIANGLASGAKRLQQIVNDMIAVSMIDSEMLALHFQRTAISYILHVVVTDLKNEMSDRDVALQIEPFDSAIQPIYADSKRLYDAFGHVVGNSIKYTPDGGHVRIAGRLLSPGPAEESVIEITIADDGIGIAPEHRERIFEKFYGTTDMMRHSSGRTKFKGGGPGLGLVVSKGIIEAHGGKIWLESPGYDEVKRPGATCHILLPMRTSPPERHRRLRLNFGEEQ